MSRRKRPQILGLAIVCFFHFSNGVGGQNPSIMIPRKSRIAKGLLALALSYPQLVSADDFTAADVLAWDRESQVAYIQNSVSMIAAITSQKDDSQVYVECVGAWYSTGQATVERQNEIRSLWTQYEDYHPQTVILAVVQKACGKVFS